MEAAGIALKEAPIETPGSIGTVERYHPPLPAAFTKIWDEVGRYMNEVECMRMAVYSVNATIGPEGLCAMVLVFGTLPRTARQMPAETQVRQQRAIEQAMADSESVHAEGRISFGLRHTGDPKGKEMSE